MAAISDLAQVKQALIQEPAIIKIGDFETTDDYVALFANDGVDVNVTTELEEGTLDMVGVVEKVISGEELTVSFSCPEVTIDILQLLYPWSEDTTSPIGLGVVAAKYVTDHVKEMRISPWSSRTNASTDFELKLWKTAPEGDVASSFGKADPWNFEVTFRAYPDLCKDDGQILGTYSLPARTNACI